jgi:hypothetical protein
MLGGRQAIRIRPLVSPVREEMRVPLDEGQLWITYQPLSSTQQAVLEQILASADLDRPCAPGPEAMTPPPTPVMSEASAPFTHTLQTYRGPGFSFQYPAGARVERVDPRRMAWQRTSPATGEIRVTGPQVWIKPGDADWSYRGPTYELTIRTYENPAGLDAESWARDYLLDAWQEAQEQKRPWGALPVTEEGEIDEDKVSRVTVAGQPAFWVSYFTFDSTQPAYYVSAGQQIVEAFSSIPWPTSRWRWSSGTCTR